MEKLDTAEKEKLDEIISGLNTQHASEIELLQQRYLVCYCIPLDIGFIISYFVKLLDIYLQSQKSCQYKFEG